MADLEEIMAGRNSAPEPTPTPAQESPPPAQEPPQEAAPQQPQQDTAPAEDEADPITGLRKALDAERGKRRKYGETVEQFERTLSVTQQQVAMLTQMLQAQQRQQPQQEQPKPPDLWDDPGAYVGNQVQQALSPVEKQMDYNARLVATALHKDAVDEAEKAFMAAYQSGQLHPADYHRVVGSQNRYVAAVEWFNQRPETQRANLEAEIRQRILTEYGIQPGQPAPAAPPQQPAPQTQNLPTSFAGHRSAGPRTTPQWSGPMALSDIMKR